MLGNGGYIPEQEKIDYIYKTLKNQNRVMWIGRVVKILILGAIIYFYLYIFPALNLTELTNKYIFPILMPTMTNMTQEINKNIGNDLNVQLKNLKKDMRTNITK